MLLVGLLHHGYQTSHVPQFIMFLLNFIILIAHLPYHGPSQTYFPSHLLCKSQTTHQFSPFNKPHTTYSSFYQPLVLHVNVGLQPYIFSNLFDHVRVGPFPPSILSAPIVVCDQSPQPTPISLTHSQLSPKVFCLSFGP